MARATIKSSVTELVQHAVEVFRAHWNKVFKDAKTKRGLSKKLVWRFLMPTQRQRKELAEAYWGVVHADKMRRLTDRQIRRQLNCYLPQAIHYAKNEYLGINEERKFIKELITGLYVLIHLDGTEFSNPVSFDEYQDSEFFVATFPSDAPIDDWSEQLTPTLVCPCSSLVVMKSTGEPFSEMEFEWLQQGIEWDIDCEGGGDLWTAEFKLMSRNQIWVRVWEMSREEYIAKVLWQIRKLSERQLLFFVGVIVTRLAHSDSFLVKDRDRFLEASRRGWEKALVDWESKIMRKCFGWPHELSHAELVAKIAQLLRNPKLDELNLKDVERAATGILGQSPLEYSYR